MSKANVIRAWGQCLDCGYEGMLEYSRIEGENYDDPEALGVVLLLRCPVCDSQDNSLVTIEYYRELIEG